MSPPPPEAQQITRASKSNLALAFVSLPRERRDDITVFYAWCRVVDDIADDPGVPRGRVAALDAWKRLADRRPANSSLAAPVRKLIAKYALPIEHFHEIIAGVEMDLDGASYATWEDLRLYCYRVASAVGLVSIEIFGCREPASRDTPSSSASPPAHEHPARRGRRLRNGGRIYLPREDLARASATLPVISPRPAATTPSSR